MHWWGLHHWRTTSLHYANHHPHVFVLCPHTLSFALTPCPLPSSPHHSPLKGPCRRPHTTCLSPLTVTVGIQHGCQGAGVQAGTHSLVAGKSAWAMCKGGEGTGGGMDGGAGGRRANEGMVG